MRTLLPETEDVLLPDQVQRLPESDAATFDELPPASVMAALAVALGGLGQ